MNKNFFYKYEDDKEDLISCGVALMWKKFESYDETKGSKGTYFCLVCKSSMICYLRKRYFLARKENELNNCSISLSTPIREDGEETLSDFISDDRNVFEEKINFETLKMLIYETLEDMKRYTAE